LQATSGDVLGLVGDAIVLCGLALSYVIYLRERSAARKRDIDSVLAMLEGVRNGMRPWGDALAMTAPWRTKADVGSQRLDHARTSPAVRDH
jgi:hypothetical protein